MKRKQFSSSQPCVSQPRRGTFYDCFPTTAHPCAGIPSAWFGDYRSGTIEEDSDTLTGGKLVDFIRAAAFVQERGVRASQTRAAAVVSDGSATLTFSAVPLNNVYLGVEIAISGRIADLQSALLTITMMGIQWFPAGSSAATAPARKVSARVHELSGSIMYIYIPFLKTVLAGVEDNQVIAASPTTAAPSILVEGFSGDGITVEATLVSSNTSELLRMTSSLELALSDED